MRLYDPCSRARLYDPAGSGCTIRQGPFVRSDRARLYDPAGPGCTIQQGPVVRSSRARLYDRAGPGCTIQQGPVVRTSRARLYDPAGPGCMIWQGPVVRSGRARLFKSELALTKGYIFTHNWIYIIRIGFGCYFGFMILGFLPCEQRPEVYFSNTLERLNVLNIE